MKTTILLAAAAVIFGLTITLFSIADQPGSRPSIISPKRGTHTQDELLVRFKAKTRKTTIAKILKEAGAVKTREFGPKNGHFKGKKIMNWRLVKLNKNSDLDKTKARLEKNPNIEIVEKNGLVHANFIPDDPRFSELWGMHNITDADIDAPEAWDRATGTEDVLVAVIDTGVDHKHEDLAANIWTNPGEIPGNGIDDDGNGYVDDIHGYDFRNNDGDPLDDHGHGTHCAGTIAAVGNNGIGVTGVSWKAKIVGIKFLSASGGGTYSDAIESVLYAAVIGAKVASNSWGGIKFLFGTKRCHI